MAHDEHWRAARTAPRDGSKIIALHKDCSGVLIVSWSEIDQMWIDQEGSNWAEGPDMSWCAGWIPAPHDTPEYNGPEVD